MTGATVLDPFRAIADPTRRRLLDLLRDGPAGFGELARELPISDAGVSQQLRRLREAGLVIRQRDGRRSTFELVPGGLGDVATWLAHHERLWDEALDRLDVLVAATADDGPGGDAPGADAPSADAPGDHEAHATEPGAGGPEAGPEKGEHR